jgi:hypothetical protein
MKNQFSEQDNDGCNYTMDVLCNYLNVTSWTHTENEYEKYDMDWSANTTNGEQIHIMTENKDRRWKWKYDEEGNAERDYDNPQFFTTYPSQMFNFEKYEYLETTDAEKCYTADYIDGVWLCDLSTLPKDKIYGEWKRMSKVRVATMDGRTEKVLQPRFFIPNEYGTFYKNPNL